MLNSLFTFNDTEQHADEHREGEPYKVVLVQGKRFELRYGYYENSDRENPLVDPMPIYPDLLASPIYTDEGYPIVTMMQDSCKHYKGELRSDKECGVCQYFERCEEFFGLCKCNARKKQT